MEGIVTLTVLQVLIDKLIEKNCLAVEDRTAIYQESTQVLLQITATNPSEQRILDEAVRYLRHLASSEDA